MRVIALAGALLIAVGCHGADRGHAGEPPQPAGASGPDSLAALPIVGTQIPLLPPGGARQLAQDHCLACHSSDMLQQQRLTATQWRAEVDKMQRWGAEIRDEDKEALALYLVTHFGSDNDRFKPIVASP
jgi:hypothetical protein